jgi:hypothetical protein
MAREADGGDRDAFAEEADAAAAAAAMVALRRSSVPAAPDVAVDTATAAAAPPRPGIFLSPSWRAASKPRSPRPRGTRPGFLEASGGGSEEGAGAGKRRSPSRSSSPTEGEEAGRDGDGEENRPRKRSAGGERRGRPGVSIGVRPSRGRRRQEVGAGQRWSALYYTDWDGFLPFVCWILDEPSESESARLFFAGPRPK